VHNLVEPVNSVASFFINAWNSLPPGLIAFLPVALMQFGHWLYEWQVLLAGLCALFAAHIWGRAVLKAAELRATPTHQPERVAPQRRSKSQSPQTPAKDLRTREPQSPALSPLETVQAFRGRIRVILGQVPCVEDPLSPSQLALCKEIGSFVLGDAAVQEAVRLDYNVLLSELAFLSALDRSASCKTAWKTLIAVNRCAREFETKLAAGRHETQTAANIANFRGRST
jgi:hypothetical protein